VLRKILLLVLTFVVALLGFVTSSAAASAPVQIDSTSHDTADLVPFTAGSTHLIAMVGAFTGVNDSTGHHAANHLAIMNSTRTRVLWANTSVDGWVQSAAAYRYGTSKAMLYVGGSFAHIAGQARSHLAAFVVTTDRNGVKAALSPSWRPSSTVDVQSIAVGGGRVYFPTGSGVRAASIFIATTIWETAADCGVHAVLYHDGYVYLGGMFISVRHGTGATLRVHGVARLHSSNGAVNMAYHVGLTPNDATCHQPSSGHNRYSGTNAWSFGASPRGLLFGGAGMKNAFGLISWTGRLIYRKPIDGDGQTVSYLGSHCACFYVGHHRSGGALKHWTWDWGSMGGIFRLSTGTEIHWRYDTAFTGGYGWNADTRNNGSITSFAAWGVWCIGGSFTRPAHGLFCPALP
jgi:hypothetical protein